MSDLLAVWATGLCGATLEARLGPRAPGGRLVSGPQVGYCHILHLTPPWETRDAHTTDLLSQKQEEMPAFPREWGAGRSQTSAFLETE